MSRRRFVAPERVGNAICNGRSFCAIGSLWAGGGVKVVEDDTTLAKSWTLPGVGEGREHDEFLRNRHGLRAAYDALNDAAGRYATRHKIELDGTFMAPIESLFEGACYFIDDENREFELDRSDLLKIIKSARQCSVCKGRCRPVRRPAHAFQPLPWSLRQRCAILH